MSCIRAILSALMLMALVAFPARAQEDAKTLSSEPTMSGKPASLSAVTEYVMVTLNFELTVSGEPPAGTRFIGQFGLPFSEWLGGVDLTDPDGDGVYTGTAESPVHPDGETAYAFVRTTSPTGIGRDENAEGFFPDDYETNGFEVAALEDGATVRASVTFGDDVQSTIRYVAMGDSYSAGEGLGPYQTHAATGNNRCHRSQSSAYSHHLSQWIAQKPVGTADHPNRIVDLEHIACSGAVTMNILGQDDNRKPNGKGQHGEDPQLEQLEGMNPKPDIVTLTIGGNNFGFVPIFKQCAWHPACHIALEPSVERRLNDLREDLRVTYKAIRNAAGSEAALFVLSYPRMFPESRAEQDCPGLDFPVPLFVSGMPIPIPGTNTDIPFSNGEQKFIRGIVTRGNRVIEDVAMEVGLHYVEIAEHFKGHEVCGKDGEWLSKAVLPKKGESLKKVGPGSFHPTKEGQRQYAIALQAYIDQKLAAGEPRLATGLPRNPEPRPKTADALSPPAQAPAQAVTSLLKAALQGDQVAGATYMAGNYTDDSQLNQDLLDHDLHDGDLNDGFVERWRYLTDVYQHLLPGWQDRPVSCGPVTVQSNFNQTHCTVISADGYTLDSLLIQLPSSAGGNWTVSSLWIYMEGQ